jgi:F1F0 ATPase subunit 2
MNETSTLALAWGAGAVLGGMFFGGLWWTVRNGMSRKQPALWFLASMLLRTSVALLGFYFVSGHDWKRLLLCVFGFVLGRPAVTWLTRSSPEAHTGPVGEAPRASQSR